jgi:hypothetical protein
MSHLHNIPHIKTRKETTVEQNTNVESAVQSILEWAKDHWLKDRPGYFEAKKIEYSRLENVSRFIFNRPPNFFLGLSTNKEVEAVNRILIDYMKKDKRALASRLLRNIRNGKGDVSETIRYLMTVVQGDSCYGAPTLAELGTDTKKLADLQKRGYLLRARRSLATARASIRRGRITADNTKPIENALRYAKAAGVALTEIGITSSEYEEMRITTQRMHAEYLLTKNDEYSVRRVLKIAKREKLTLAQLNTSHDELATKLRITARTIAYWRAHPESLTYNPAFESAIQLGLVTYEEVGVQAPLPPKEEARIRACADLNHMRAFLKNGADDTEIRYFSYYSVSRFRELLQQAGLSVFDIGTSDQELYDIEREITKLVARRDLLEMRGSGRSREILSRRYGNMKVVDIVTIMRKFRLTPHDVGVSETEIELLLKHQYGPPCSLHYTL